MSRHKGGVAGGRAPRVAAEIHHELARMIRAEVKDPRVGLVTLTGVDLTPDYAYATVWFTVLPDDPASIESTREGLQRASGFLRAQLGRRVRIHTNPELRFVHDPSVERGASMSALIDAATALQRRD